jgi:RNA polymerase sigma-70 factor (ECF subfamily)
MNQNESRVPVSAPRTTFPTTHWSLVLTAGAGSEAQVRAALEALCRQYWYPLYSFVRRSGRPHHEAEDCTQAFLERLLATEGMARARPERGRFRSFLMVALRHFLSNEWLRTHAEKRGGGQPTLPLDFSLAGERFAHEPADSGLTPEAAFDQSWALELTESVMEELRAEYEKSGRGALFTTLAPLVWGNNPDETLSVPAARVGLEAHAFTVTLQRLRRRVGDRLRARVADTVGDPGEIDDELRFLAATLTSAGGR